MKLLTDIIFPDHFQIGTPSAEAALSDSVEAAFKSRSNTSFSPIPLPPVLSTNFSYFPYPYCHIIVLI